MWNDWNRDVRTAAARTLGRTGNGKVCTCLYLVVLCLLVLALMFAVWLHYCLLSFAFIFVGASVNVHLC